ncbi:MAG: glycosyltransferase [Bacteroidales bacterium]|nr:glycosyltransferase [Bacteroidales bacterium]
MANDKAFVSVLMSVYAEPIPVLNESIDSILRQTHSNFEFFVFLDKPDNEDLWRYLQDKATQDGRLIVHKNTVNRFLAGTLNDELKLAKGDYIVRMDGDDISVPFRIEHLVNYMEKHQEVGVASSWMQEFGHKRKIDNRLVRYESDYDKMRVNYLCQTPIAHAPCIIRRNVVEQYGPILYNERCSKTQDYELWSRLIRCGVVFGMVPEPLYLRRCSQGAGANPIKYQVIHNQVARRNIGYVLNQVNISLPDVVDKGMIANVSAAVNKASGVLRNQLRMILCILYSNVYANPLRRVWTMITNRDFGSWFVLSSRMKIHFIRPGKLTEINNMVTSPNQLIYAG